MPDEARALAREFGVHYYEASVLTYYGVNDVFENAIRAALISRRNQRFWMTSLKKVQRPLLQVRNYNRFSIHSIGKNILKKRCLLIFCSRLSALQNRYHHRFKFNLVLTTKI